jgi:hypothetical protein
MCHAAMRDIQGGQRHRQRCGGGWALLVTPLVHTLPQPQQTTVTPTVTVTVTATVTATCSDTRLVVVVVVHLQECPYFYHTVLPVGHRRQRVVAAAVLRPCCPLGLRS